MSAHHLSIAKASFAAGLLRPDITKVGRDDLVAFHSLLEAAINSCTTRNIQRCKEWIVTNIAPSATRTAALGKYLSSFSKHAEQRPQNHSDRKGASSSRKKLHILYILHDVVHHIKYHTSNSSIFSAFTASLQQFLIELFQSTASEQRARVLLRLNDLLVAWESEQFFSRDYITKLQQSITRTGTLDPDAGEDDTTTPPIRSDTKDAAFVMPATHGDPATPYYDLPAGNLLPLLKPGSSMPIRPEQVKALRLTAGPADKPLVNAMKDFLKDVESMEHRYSIPDGDAGVSEIDELGQVTIRDEAGNITGDTYYGWSRAFCEKMQHRRKGLSSDNHHDRSLSRGSSRSPGQSPRKRLRYSDSEESRSLSPSRSPPRFRAASPADHSEDQRRWQPAQAPQTFAQRFQSSQPAYAPPLPPPPPPPVAMLHNLVSNPMLFAAPPLGPNGLPIPPPRPANWTGPWPPPPPNLGMMPSSRFSLSNNFPTPAPPPPPPPPPPSGYRDMYGDGYR